MYGTDFLLWRCMVVIAAHRFYLVACFVYFGVVVGYIAFSLHCVSVGVGIVSFP